jgi:DNA-binding MarR family transcriptional regulator
MTMARRDAPELAAAALTHLRRIIHAIHAQSAAIESAVGLTGPQLWALREIDQSEKGLSLGEVAARLALHPANAGRLVDKLVRKKVVRRERPANDRRYVVVRVTPRGAALASKSPSGPAQADLLARIRSQPVASISRIERVLGELVELLGAGEADAGPLFDESKRGRATK